MATEAQARTARSPRSSRSGAELRRARSPLLRRQRPPAFFDPPEEPEPLVEYSIWERPTAELIRREEPEPPRPAAKIAGALRTWRPSPRLWLLSAATVSVVAIAAVLALTLGSQRDRHGSTTGRLASSGTSARASSRANVGSPTRPAAHPKTPKTDRPARSARSIAKKHSDAQRNATTKAPPAESAPSPAESTAQRASNESASAPSNAAGTSVQEPRPSTTATTTVSSTTPPAGEGAQTTTSGASEGATTASTAAREFGFEH